MRKASKNAGKWILEVQEIDVLFLSWLHASNLLMKPS